MLWLHPFVAAGCAALVVASCTPGPAPASPQPSVLDASSGALIDAGVDASIMLVVDAKAEGPLAATRHLDTSVQSAAIPLKAADAGPTASGPAREGEVCATYAMPQPEPAPALHRPCAPGLVCCVPPHGAVMRVETAICRVPCRPTTPTAKPQVAGCSESGCPWAMVP